MTNAATLRKTVASRLAQLSQRRHAGLIFCKASTSHRSHFCIRNGTEKLKKVAHDRF